MDFALAPNEVWLQSGLRSDSLQIAEADQSPIGFLSYSILWGTLPFLELIEVSPSSRGQNLGREMVRAWEQMMADRGFDLVLTSTNADGDAQNFWRKIGYTDCGALTVRSKAAEVFFQRRVETHN
jgi:ribosomal protein S18 acetylase RimI-like enzyme